MRRLILLLCLVMTTPAMALDRITEADVRAFLDQQATHTMHKDIEPLTSLFAPEYHHLLTRENRVLDRDAWRKIQSANFMVATLILCTIELRQLRIREDGRQAIIRTHNRNRYLIRLKDKQDIIEQEDDLEGELVLRDGKIVYLNTEKL